jgi:hypothetical protein
MASQVSEAWRLQNVTRADAMNPCAANVAHGVDKRLEFLNDFTVYSEKYNADLGDSIRLPWVFVCRLQIECSKQIHDALLISRPYIAYPP